MKKRRRRVDPQIKAQILKIMAEDPGCRITNLSKLYNVSKTSLHYWRSQMKVTVGLAPGVMPGNRFVEVSVKDSKVGDLKKASLIFQDMTLDIEGRVSSSDLMSILKILEGSC